MGDVSNDEPVVIPIPEYDCQNLKTILPTLDIRNYKGVQSYIEIILKHIISNYGHEFNAKWALAVAALLRTQLAALKEEREATEAQRLIEEKAKALGNAYKGWRMGRAM